MSRISAIGILYVYRYASPVPFVLSYDNSVARERACVSEFFLFVLFLFFFVSYPPSSTIENGKK